VLSVITLAELEAGISASSEPDAARRAVQALVDRVPVLPLSEDAARAYGPIMVATHERKADILDKLIAAHAVAEDLIVITNSTRDFVDYPGLQIEDWSVSPPYRPLVDLATGASDATD
jgi:tRNA(fMet)-specific endonuclease VapC